MKKNNKLIIVGNTSNAKLAHHYFSKDSDYEVIAFSVNKEYISNDMFSDDIVCSFQSRFRVQGMRELFLL